MYIKKSINGESINFILKNLESFNDNGKNLMSKIIDKIHNSKFSIWGFYPVEIMEKEIYDFESGGKFESKPLDEVTSLVVDQLENKEKKGWVLIDNTKSHGYPYNQSILFGITNYFTWDDIFLHLYYSTNIKSEEVKNTFQASGAYPFIGIITNISNDINKRIFANCVNENDIDFLIGNMTYLFIGAYDEESYIIVQFE